MATLTARQAYRMGLFNTCSVLCQPDGSAVYACGGVKAPAPFVFHVRDLDSDQEELLLDMEVREGQVPWTVGAVG
jgi:hypothetical protein